MTGMYEIKSGKQQIDGIDVTTWMREIWSANILEVEVGTTGPRGGDSGHGGRTFLRIQDLGSTDLRVAPLCDQYGCRGVKLLLGGDSELATFIEALRFAVMVLEKEAAGGVG